MAASGKGVEGRAARRGQHKEGSDGKATPPGVTPTGGPQDVGLADEDNNEKDYYPTKHAYLQYSHEFTAMRPTPHVLNTDDSPMY